MTAICFQSAIKKGKKEMKHITTIAYICVSIYILYVGMVVKSPFTTPFI